MRERFALTLLDCPPSLGPVTVNALAAADRVIVPVQAEYLALEGLVQFLDTLGLIRRELNPSLVLTGVVITMHDERTRLAQDVERELRSHFADLVFDTVIPRSVRVAEAPSFGVPVIEHAPTRGGRPPTRACDGARRREAATGSRRRRPRPRLRLRPSSEALMTTGAWDGAWRRSCRRPRSASRSFRDIPVGMIQPNPDQPRKRFDPESIEALAGSLRDAGVIQPLIVRPLADGRYELIAGERRWRAAREAGLETVPALDPRRGRDRAAADRADRERGPGGPQPG